MTHAHAVVGRNSKSVMVPKSLDDLKIRLDDLKACCHIDDLIAERARLTKQSESAGFWDDIETATKISKKISDNSFVIDKYTDALKLFEDTKCAAELAEEDSTFVEVFERNQKELVALIEDMEVESWFTGKFDKGSAILSIHPGQGGFEAQDWTEMLFRMYTHYCHSKGWSVEELDVVRGDKIGLDRAVIQIDGHNAYGMLRSEIGVHRLVRISPTDIKKRRHTTFASVELLPVLPDDIDVQINQSDLRIDVYRSSGPGGQCVNTTDSAVRITHIPTGIVVTCQNRKSQLLNKESAMSVLRSKLYEIEEEKRADEIDELRGERMDNAFGSQIRNYVLYPFQLVKDTRTEIETSNANAVLDGDIEDFVIGYHKFIASK